MDKIKIAIVEDDADWLKAMTNFINREDDMAIVATATTKEQALNIAKANYIDVIIMDINLNENKCDGILAAVEILRFKNVKVIMLTSLKDDEIIKDAFTAGAVNFVSKDHYKEIPNAIRTACADDSPMEVLLKEFARLKKEEQLKDLTMSEKEVYELMEQGLSNNQICKKLFKTNNTLKTQIKNILKKIGVNSGREAVEKVAFKGLNTKNQ